MTFPETYDEQNVHVFNKNNMYTCMYTYIYVCIYVCMFTSCDTVKNIPIWENYVNLK